MSLLNILITVVIIAILVIWQLQGLQQAKRQFDPGLTPSGQQSGFSVANVQNQMRQIHLMQLAYHQRYGKYATWEELVSDGSVPKGYVLREDEEQGVAYIRGFNLKLHATKDSYLLLAFPNSESAKMHPDEYIPSYRIDQTGEFREEDGWEDPHAGEFDDPGDPLDDLYGSNEEMTDPPAEE